MQKNRRLPRWETNLAAYFRLEENDTPVACTIKDINLMGLQIITDHELNIDEPLKLKIVILNKVIINAQAKVVWHKTTDKPNIYGLVFTRISNADREKINRLILDNFLPEMSKTWWENLK